MNNELVKRLQDFLEREVRSCSMEPECVTAEYVCRIRGGVVPIKEIEAALAVIRSLG